MSSIGSGVMEIRIHTGVEHRVFYVAKLEEAVYVLHAFEKKGRKRPGETSSSDEQGSPKSLLSAATSHSESRSRHD